MKELISSFFHAHLVYETLVTKMCGGDLLALVVMNPIEDFFGKNSVFELKNKETAISQIKELIAKVKDHNSPVVYVVDNHLPEEIEFLSIPKHGIRNTLGRKIISELTPDDATYIIEKRRYSGFYETGLDQLLKDLGIGVLIIAGGMLETDVAQTCIDARFRNYEIYLVDKTYGCMDQNSKDTTLEYLKKFYDVELLQMDELHDILHEYSIDHHEHDHEHSHEHGHQHNHEHTHAH